MISSGALEDYNTKVDVYDPCIDVDEAQEEYRYECLTGLRKDGAYDAVVLAVSHRDFVSIGGDGMRRCGISGAIAYDVKCTLPRRSADLRF